MYIYFKKKIVLSKLKYFFSIFLLLFIFFPLAYFYISTTQADKRTDYPGRDIAKAVQEWWNDKRNGNEILYVQGNEWQAGNLSYHLKDRPKWIGDDKKLFGHTYLCDPKCIDLEQILESK